MLARSPSVRLRAGFAALKRLSLFLAYAESEAGSENPTWTRIGYPGPRSVPKPPELRLPLATVGDGERIAADVVVIGSGAGGGAAASAFARGGKRVVVLETGGAYTAHDFNQREFSISQLYLDGGLTATDDLGVTILAGSCLGGGTTVNWCTSLRLPPRIAQEWEQRSGIAGLESELAPHYDEIERRLDVRFALQDNANNRVILDGARTLGVHVEASPRNAAAECGDGCGYCGFGCAYGNKHSTPAALLTDLAASDGAIYVGATALRIETSGARAHRVLASARVAGEMRSFSVDAELVVVAAGTLRTPGILARSGIRGPSLGHRLFLHPVAAAVVEFDRRIEPWRGPMQSAYSDAFNYRRGNYGAKVEVAPAHPGLAALALPWVRREQHAAWMERLPNIATLLAITRDRDPGSVGLDDEAAIHYRVSPFDGESLLAGLVGLFDLAFAAGAVRAATLHVAPIQIERSQWGSRKRAELAAQLRRIGVGPNRQILFSAHQMGTAAMGCDPKCSVVDSSGRVWGYENLLVADASVFPQSSGVNPMLTIMAMANRVAAIAMR